MKSKLSIRIKLLLALTIALFAVRDASAQATLKKIELKGSKPAARSGHALVNVNGKVFLLGGFDGKFAASDFRAAGDFFAQQIFDDIWQFDEGQAPFEEITPVNEKPKQVKFPNIVGHDGKIYNLFGFVEGVGFNSDAFVYDPVLNRWGGNSTSGDMSCKDRINVNLASVDNDVYAFSGLGSGIANVLTANCKYNPLTGEWTKLAPMPEGRIGAAIFVDRLFSSEDIVVLGGKSDPRKDPTGDVFSYDTQKDTWGFVFNPDPNTNEVVAQAGETTRELLTRAFSAYVQVDNILYMFGGEGKNFQLLDDIIKVEFKADDTFTVKRLDVKFPAGFSQSSAALVSLTPATGFEAAALQTAEILIFGGSLNNNQVSGDAFIFTDTVEVTAPPEPECTGGPVISSVSIGGKTKIKGKGFLEGLSITVNGTGFTKAAAVTANKVTQKGLLTNGQSAAEACASGCELKITNGDGKCTKVAAP